MGWSQRNKRLWVGFFLSLKGDLNCLYCNLITAPGKFRNYGKLLFSKEEEEKVMWFGLFKIFLGDPVKLKTNSEEFVNLQLWSTTTYFVLLFFFFRNLNFVDHWGLNFFQPLCSRASTMLIQELVLQILFLIQTTQKYKQQCISNRTGLRAWRIGLLWLCHELLGDLEEIIFALWICLCSCVRWEWAGKLILCGWFLAMTQQNCLGIL